MATKTDPLDTLDKLSRLRALLSSGEAWDTVLKSGLSTAQIAEAMCVKQPNAWAALNNIQFPKRDAALRLLELLDRLEKGGTHGR